MAFDETGKIWFNGELVDWKDAQIHVLSHVVHYGSSVFEGLRCYDTENGPAVFRLKDHMKRLHDSAKVYRMDIPYTVDELCEAVQDTININNNHSKSNSWNQSHLFMILFEMNYLPHCIWKNQGSRTRNRFHKICRKLSSYHYIIM